MLRVNPCVALVSTVCLLCVYLPLELLVCVSTLSRISVTVITVFKITTDMFSSNEYSLTIAFFRESVSYLKREVSIFRSIQNLFLVAGPEVSVPLILKSVTVHGSKPVSSTPTLTAYFLWSVLMLNTPVNSILALLLNLSVYFLSRSLSKLYVWVVVTFFTSLLEQHQVIV
jgi:hypothetical protein